MLSPAGVLIAATHLAPPKGRWGGACNATKNGIESGRLKWIVEDRERNEWRSENEECMDCETQRLKRRLELSVEQV
jgi:hypothetical protein